MTTDVRFAVPSLAQLDALWADALVLFFFNTERPLRGVGGLVDWRLAGHLSGLLHSGWVSGERGERLLVPLDRRLPFDRLLLIGLGDPVAWDSRSLGQVLRAALDTLARAHARVAVMSLPGRSTGVVAPVDALETLLTELESFPDLDQLTVLEDAQVQRDMRPVVERQRQRQRASE